MAKTLERRKSGGRGFPPVEHRQLVDHVREVLRGAILEGKLPPGARLVEARVAGEMQVSRAPVREAIRALTDEGLVTVQPRRGASVVTISAQDVWEVYTLRAALEIHAFRLAQKRITPSQRSHLGSLVDKMRRAASEGNSDVLSKLDVEFHESVVRASGNARLLRAWMEMIGQVRVLSHRVIATLYVDLESVAQRHETLRRTLLDGGTSADVACAVEEHLYSAAGRVMANFGQAGFSEEGVT